MNFACGYDPENVPFNPENVPFPCGYDPENVPFPPTQATPVADLRRLKMLLKKKGLKSEAQSYVPSLRARGYRPRPAFGLLPYVQQGATASEAGKPHASHWFCREGGGCMPWTGQQRADATARRRAFASARPPSCGWVPSRCRMPSSATKTTHTAFIAIGWCVGPFCRLRALVARLCASGGMLLCSGGSLAVAARRRAA